MFDFLVAIYHLCADFHSGQTSLGYKLGCQAATKLRAWYEHNPTLDDGLTRRQLVLYHRLREHYANSL